MERRGWRKRDRSRKRVANVLERGGIFPSANPSRAVDGADGAAGIAVTAAVGHALGAGVGIDPSAVGNGRHWRIGRHGGTSRIHGRSASGIGAVLVRANAARDYGDRIGTEVAAVEALKWLRSGTVIEGWKTRRRLGNGISLALEF